jgi:dienelactone hydrolase
MNTTLSTLRKHHVRIPSAGVILRADLTIPAGAEGLVILVHGSGNSTLSPRNRLMAGEMHRRGLATLIFDILTPDEASTDDVIGPLAFNIPLLTERLVGTTSWAQQHKDIKHLNIGYLSFSTGAAAALAAAAAIPQIQAVVCRGGRTDLAGEMVKRVDAPTLLIVAELDPVGISWNEKTLKQLPAIKHLSLIPDTSSDFDAPGALEKSADLAAAWFELYLRNPIKELQ